MGKRFWLQFYPPGIPHDIDAQAFTSVRHILETSCRRFADRPAYSNLGHTLTYAELERLSRAFGAFLQQRLGLQKGDRLAIMLPNVLQYPVALFGAFQAGLTVVNVNPLYTARELEYQLKDSGAAAIVVLVNFAHTLQEALPQTQIRTVITTQLGDLLPTLRRCLVNFVVRRIRKLVPAWRIDGALAFRDTLKAGRHLPLDVVPLSHDDIAFLQYTGGTTGLPKGAMLTHGNMVANLQQASAWLAQDLVEGEETVITPLPLYHIFSLTANALAFMKIGGHNILITNPRDLPALVKELRKVRFSVIIGVNTLFNALLNTPGFAQLDFSALKVCLTGGMATHRAVAERWRQVTGKPVIEAYGLTECAPGVCINPLSNVEFNGSVGLPVPATEVSIRDDLDQEAPLGTVGEICVRGPQVMKGYWNRPEETAAAFSPDGWLRTGDLGVMDEQGYVRITDRKKDMINVSGFKVYPNEVEDVAATHPGVLEVGAVGVPDEQSGEAVKLFVVRRDPGLTAAALIEHCRARLTGYKVPKYVEFRAGLPKTPIGKVLRRALRDQS